MAPPVDVRVFSKTDRRVVSGSNPGCTYWPSRLEHPTKILYVLLFGFLLNWNNYGIRSFRKTLNEGKSPYSLRFHVIKSDLYLEPTNQSCISDIEVHFDRDCENIS